MKRFTDVRAHWLCFVYIICAIFHVVFIKGISLPFFRKLHHASVNQRSLTRLSIYLK